MTLGAVKEKKNHDMIFYPPSLDLQCPEIGWLGIASGTGGAGPQAMTP